MSASVSPSAKVLLVASAALVLSGLLQLCTSWIQLTAQTRPAVLPENAYTWRDSDHPNALPLDLTSQVGLTIENTRHYALDTSDANAEYWSMNPGTSQGFVRLGPQYRFFGVAMYHQLHCVNALRMAILGDPTAPAAMEFKHVPHINASLGAAQMEADAKMRLSGEEGMKDPRVDGHGKRNVPHIQHCLNYLRSTILCAADTTLEPELFPGAQDVGAGLGVTHVCRDWGAVHAFTERNAKESAAWLKEHGNVNR